MKPSAKIPVEAGYYMPAEWETQAAVWLEWPHGYQYEGHQMKLEKIWLQMTHHLHEHIKVCVIACDERHREHIRYLFKYFGFNERRIDVFVIPNNDVWMRDNGPIFVVNGHGGLAMTDWNFNGWGGSYQHDLDCRVSSEMGRLLELPIFTAPITSEGGAIEINGNGTLMATRSSIINPNRNPGKSQQEIEAALEQYLGIRHFIWLSGAPGDVCEAMGDGTDYHVDIAARFVDETTVLYSWTDDRSAPHYPYLKQHLIELREAVTQAGKPLTLVPLPLPEKGVRGTWTTSSAGYTTRITDAAYTNYLVTNNLVIVPVYGNQNDEKAKAIIGEHFPDREIVGIPALEVTEEGGAMHCVTQQQPVV